MPGRMLDVTFDFRTDTPTGKDPDSHSPTLKTYHKILWSKVLPIGNEFKLQDDRNGTYLYHSSNLGDFRLSSDTVINGFANFKAAAEIRRHFSRIELEQFESASYTIGGMMIFPGNRINGKATINGSRGFNTRIKDRFDLTLECIRLHYLGIENPLGKTLNLYSDFFDLFFDFRGYVQFFHLEDLVSANFKEVNFFTPWDNFKSSAIPKSAEEYSLYLRKASEFIANRNNRIANRII